MPSGTVLGYYVPVRIHGGREISILLKLAFGMIAQRILSCQQVRTNTIHMLHRISLLLSDNTILEALNVIESFNYILELKFSLSFLAFR
jgi:hypothetical protein